MNNSDHEYEETSRVELTTAAESPRGESNQLNYDEEDDGASEITAKSLAKITEKYICRDFFDDLDLINDLGGKPPLSKKSNQTNRTPFNHSKEAKNESSSRTKKVHFFSFSIILLKQETQFNFFRRSKTSEHNEKRQKKWAPERPVNIRQ